LPRDNILPIHEVFPCNQLSFNLARFFSNRYNPDEKIFRFGKSRYFQTLIHKP